jgi:SAM-dependent methyltransferase
MSLYGILKPVYKKFIPASIQRLTLSRRYPFYLAVNPLKKFLQKSASHDEIYDHYFYQESEEPLIEKCAEVMADSIYRHFNPECLIDVGCGTGMLLMHLKKRGVKVLGYEYAKAAIDIGRSRGIDICKLDLEQEVLPLVNGADLVASMEVAEHLPASIADRYIDFLCHLSSHVIMTAAIPGQGGTDHVNEQPNEYWIEKFRQRGYDYDLIITKQIRQEWKSQAVTSFYHRNLMVFHKSPSLQ